MRLDAANSAYLSESEIIASILSGNRDNFRYLVAAHQDKVYAMVRRQVPDAQLAAELTQESFVKAYINLPSFRFESSFSTWLIRIALNVTNTYFRSRRFKELKQTVPLEPDEERAAEGLHSTAVDRQDLLKLRSAIAQLKPIYRDVVVLCWLENRTYEEAAAILEIPRGTVCSRINKAFRILKEAFAAAV